MAASYRKGKLPVKIRRIIVSIIIAIILFTSVNVQASNIGIDTKDAKEGIVRVSYAGSNKKMKVMVEKGSTKYFYDLKNEEELYPLQFGQGNYTVAVLENVSGNQYKVLTKKSFNANISEKNAVFLKSVQPVLWDESNEAIKLAKELTQDDEKEEEILQSLYDYMVSNIDYDYDKMDKLESDYIPDIDTVLNDGKGICYDYSVLFAAMLRSKGIATKLVKGYKNDLSAYHAWNEVYIDGSWKIVDTTYDAALKRGRVIIEMYKDAAQYEKVKEY